MEQSVKHVVVAYDASEESAAAVKWAAVVAKRRNAPLTVITATGWEDLNLFEDRDKAVAVSQRLVQTTAEEGAQIARDEADIDVHAAAVQQGVVAALEEASREAQLVVVGYRGPSKGRGLRGSSVASAVAMHAACPVAVVRSETTQLPDMTYPSVIGVDGSASSKIALAQAARWAEESNSLLRIVTSWRAPLLHPWSSITVDEETQQVQREGAVKASRKAVEIARQAYEYVHDNYPTVRVEQLVLEGRPSEVLVEASKDASIVIVGARGLGDFASLLLGSVSRDVIEQSESPVYVVR